MNIRNSEGLPITKGDVVSFSHSGYAKNSGMPLFPTITRPRNDSTWIDIIRQPHPTPTLNSMY